MVKPAWGMKRTCQGCGVRFYDLQRDPIICPKCATVYDPDAVSRTRRGRSSAAVAKAAPRAAAVPELAESAGEAPTPELEEAGLEIAEDESGDAEGEDIIEDTEDLPEDDVTEVIENVDEEES